jgi:hypothetical protein
MTVTTAPIATRMHPTITRWASKEEPLPANAINGPVNAWTSVALHECSTERSEVNDDNELPPSE